MYLLDSTVLIDHFNDVHPATEWISSHAERSVYISVVTYAEVLAGFPSNVWPRVTGFLDKFECLSVTRSIALKAAEFRQSHKFKLPDAFQAAIAVEHKITLITRDSGDFNPHVHKFVKIPYRWPIS